MRKPMLLRHSKKICGRLYETRTHYRQQRLVGAKACGNFFQLPELYVIVDVTTRVLGICR